MAAATTLVVVSYYDRRPTGNLERLLASLSKHDAGEAYDLVIVANRTSDAPLRLGAETLERENLGMNIGAWDHGWRAKPGYGAYLFLQDECFAVRDGWLSAFTARAGEIGFGMLGETLNGAWDLPWPKLRERHTASLPDHTIDGRPAPRVDVYLDFMRRAGIEPGASGRHLRSLTWFLTRPTLERIDGFPIGANYGECIAAEIGVSRKIEALGGRVEQVAPAEEFRFFRHVEYNRDRPGALYTHKPATKAQNVPGGATIFRVHSASPMLASTRYRALMPALGLEELGVKTTVTDAPLSAEALRACRAIVFSKALRASDMELAFEAHRLGAPIVLDICDDMFAPGYGEGREALYTATFQAMARLAAAVVTTGAALRDTLKELAPDAAITIIPDQLETPELLARVLNQHRPATPTWGERAAFALRDPAAAFKRAQARLSALTPPAPQPKATPQTPGQRTLIWFGNHGAPYSAFGMGALAPVLPHISALAADHKVKLLVVSNSREKFEALTRGVSFATEYREWSPTRIFADLDGADICLMPVPRERFALAKSANRAALALSRGTAVVADSYPGLDEFAPGVITDDWASGLRLYLEDEPRRLADIARGQEIIARYCSPQAVARQWAALIQSLPERT